MVWNELPKVVLVEFPGATFQLTGLAPGVYPITPQRRTWFLDAGRKHPCLAVTRKQLPLLPAFAMTAHQAQGQTLKAGVIADLNYTAISGAMTAYIAMTRVQNRKDLLILRAFNAELFQQGDQSFRKLLLQHWRSHDVDWDAIVRRCIQTRVCCECRAERPKLAFTAGQWKRTDAAVCKECVQTYRERGTLYRCCRCQRWQAAEAFPGKPVNFHLWQTTCLMCKEKRQCGTCDQWFDESAYTKHGWCSKRDRVCAGCRAQLKFPHIGLRSRRRLHRRVEKTRQERRKRVLEAVRQEIDARRRRRRCVCSCCGAEIEAGTQGQPAKHGGAICSTKDVPACVACTRLQQGGTLAACTYHCPVCSEPVTSNVREGRVDNRHACGHRFQVSNGQVVAAAPARTQEYSYECPQCGRAVHSDIRDGRIDNRRRLWTQIYGHGRYRGQGRRSGPTKICLQVSGLPHKG